MKVSIKTQITLILCCFCSFLSYSAPSVLDHPHIEACANQTYATDNDITLTRQLDANTDLPKEGQDKTISHIKLAQLNVFDTNIPAEDNPVFRFANRAHITTEPTVIMTLLLFAEGDEYSIKKIVESERLLRNQSYLYDARVYADENCEGNITVTVVTRDLWTLLPDLSFSRSGGENSSRIGFRESNLFGWGKRLSLTHTKDQDRSGYLFVYDDPNIMSTRYRGRLEYADNDDGERHYVGVSYPFFSTDTPYSYGFLNFNDKRTESLYEDGETVSEFSQQTEVSKVYFGHAQQLTNNWTQRLTVGYHYEQQTFSPLLKTTLPLAHNRTLSYPYIQTQWLEDKFIKVRNFDSIYRTEDLNLGWDINALLGYSDKSLSDDDNHLIYQFSANKAHYTSDHSLWRINLSFSGQWNSQDNTARNLITQLGAQYYLNTSIQDSWYANIQLRFAKNLTADQQLTLGGETGLRGFPVNYQHGSKSVLVNIERRYYWEYDLLQLFKVGGAVYFDIGRIRGNTLVHSDPNYLKNIGAGLRLAPSRANAGLVLHLDVAAPLNGPDNIDNVQWLFTVKNRF
ncbi:hypothetical protein PCIT_a3317 [Pseudoalteromonas citrea]|uniref:Haemolysin activator HlyB C-terminal domain-containing protein n=3 Tax=Pseudoalteromonas TaxID=53246 RepID=A0AAD4AGQ5_9GAMM|nr:hypothetical protein [Pseudoalteromonas citrea]KAF7768815.1 hypothetical protein PCIT_a3317 [Pseudoalteromonas citrea]